MIENMHPHTGKSWNVPVSMLVLIAMSFTYDFTGHNVTLLKKYPGDNLLDCNSMFFGFSAPKIGGVLIKTFYKGSFTHFFQKKAPGGGVLPDFTRRGNNYLHTSLLKTYQKSNL